MYSGCGIMMELWKWINSISLFNVDKSSPP